MASMTANIPHSRRRPLAGGESPAFSTSSADAGDKRKGSLADLALAGRRVAVGLGVHCEPAAAAATAPEHALGLRRSSGPSGAMPEAPPLRLRSTGGSGARVPVLAALRAARGLGLSTCLQNATVPRLSLWSELPSCSLFPFPRPLPRLPHWA